MLAWSASLARAANVSRAICVVGSDNDDVKEAAKNLGLDIAIQQQQLGTANAVMAAEEILGDFSGNIVVLYADTPLIQIETLEKVFTSLENKSSAVVLGFDTSEPNSYGRLITEGDRLTAIVEAKEASPDQLSISLCNSGI
jgi:bifunctional UDP-N-acetylglucosamine pyrophosphorylase/glucosamine-1-phosphate N-acetyltransferase